jgi:hypothetical protein
MRYDAYKVCRGRRRPLAQKTGGIGIWEHLLHIVAVVAVLTNCWLIAFTNSDFAVIAEKFGTLATVAIVVAWEHVMLLIKYVMQTTTSPLPKCVRDEIQKEQHRLEQQRYSTMRTKKNSRRSQFQKGESSLSLPPSKSPARKEVNASDQMGLRSQGMMTPEPYGHLRTILSSEEDSEGALFSC